MMQFYIKKFSSVYDLSSGFRSIYKIMDEHFTDEQIYRLMLLL